MKPHAKVIVTLILAGIAAFSAVSALEDNSTSQSKPTDWLEYTPLIGVLGTAIGIYSLFERRKDRARNAQITEWLEGNVKLSDLSKKVEELEGNKQLAQDYIDNALSVSVQNVALRERAKVLADLVAKSYLDYNLTMGKLKEMPLEAEIPEAIKSDVLDNLVPEYEKQREKETLKDRVSILSISLLIVNSVFANMFGYLFYPIRWFGNAVLGLLLVFSLIQLAKPQINEFDADLQKILREGVRTSYFIAYIVLLLVGIMFLFLGILFTLDTLNHNSTPQEVQLSIALVIGGALLLIGGGVLAYTSLRKSRIKLH